MWNCLQTIKQFIVPNIPKWRNNNKKSEKHIYWVYRRKYLLTTFKQRWLINHIYIEWNRVSWILFFFWNICTFLCTLKCTFIQKVSFIHSSVEMYTMLFSIFLSLFWLLIFFYNINKFMIFFHVCVFYALFLLSHILDKCGCLLVIITT